MEPRALERSCAKRSEEKGNVQMRPVHGRAGVQDQIRLGLIGLIGLGACRSRRIRAAEFRLLGAVRLSDLAASCRGHAQSSPSFAQEHNFLSPVSTTGLLSVLARTACQPLAICNKIRIQTCTWLATGRTAARLARHASETAL